MSIRVSQDNLLNLYYQDLEDPKGYKFIECNHVGNEISLIFEHKNKKYKSVGRIYYSGDEVSQVFFNEDCKEVEKVIIQTIQWKEVG